jgi:hypothetical protein
MYLVYDYGTRNNGGVPSRRIGVSEPARSLFRKQVYGYDRLNRLITAGETLLRANFSLQTGASANTGGRLRCGWTIGGRVLDECTG